MKIEFITPYLPHGLQVRIEDYRSNYVGREFDEVIGLHQWDKSRSLWSVLTDGGAKPSIEKVKLVLRPLSELTREELEEAGFNSYIDCLTYGNKGVEWTLKAPYDMVVYLISKHYDIYGLIEQGYALNINELKNNHEPPKKSN